MFMGAKHGRNCHQGSLLSCSSSDFRAEISGISLLSFVGTSLFLLCAHCCTMPICFIFSVMFLPLLLLDVCLFENKLEVGNAPNTFLPPGKCKEQTLWLFNGCFEISNKFNHVALETCEMTPRVSSNYCLSNLAHDM